MALVPFPDRIAKFLINHGALYAVPRLRGILCNIIEDFYEWWKLVATHATTAKFLNFHRRIVIEDFDSPLRDQIAKNEAMFGSEGFLDALILT